MCLRGYSRSGCIRVPRRHAPWATRICSRGCRERRFVTLASGDPDGVRAGALPIHADARVRIATFRVYNCAMRRR
jgi:hypothetical protein